MNLTLRKILGWSILTVAVAVFVYGIYLVARGGSCSSGGVHVSTRQCASGSTAWMFALPPTLLAGLGGLWLARSGSPRRPATPTMSAASAQQVRLLFGDLAPAADPVAQLERLQAMFEAGALTAEEFQRAKAAVLGG